jgi:hypothetical protein
MVQQCSENQYRWEHITVYMCVERFNSFGARQIVLYKIFLKHLIRYDYSPHTDSLEHTQTTNI